ncbi:MULTISPECIES: transporter substrate-binding domain-containing protein [unclassified Leptolyngbya]|uniref:transporter substrate-binding domain-containing protein n=1 Tax=unclassified Leptolyngbya TaxID=2650499 RepID=UPI0016849EDC|nr:MULTISPECIES: transporter substrate-binding domain-containing protein [unclassified Leptolyngbya]MBD1913286.1 transporter substrate-binding domain-containing protein [Leptolyngbya sp. FACHB-8]MBD2154375.1 transporter substrate-binding domain-containing protein [Leptolyngbya sp. FACHB-16]
MKRRQLFSVAFVGTIAAIGLLNACTSSGGDSNTAAQSKTLTMATSADYPPYEFIQTSGGREEIVGFDVDIAKAIAEELGYEVQIQNIDFNGLIPALQADRADFVMAGMTPTEERKQNADFSIVYYEAKNTIVSRKDSGLTDAASLNGKKVGVQLGSIQEGAAKEIQGANVVQLNRINEIIQELKAGRIDAAIVEDTVAKGFIDANPDLEFNVIPNEGESGSAIAFPKGSPLKAEFDPVLQRMVDSGKITELVNKWFGDQQPAK